MIAGLARVRTIALAFLLLAGGLAAAVSSPAEEAAAAGPRVVDAYVGHGYSGSYIYAYGQGSTYCSSSGSQAMVVSLYANDSLVQSGGSNRYSTWLVGSSPSVWAYCGVAYQVKVVHYFYGSPATTTWSRPFRFC